MTHHIASPSRQDLPSPALLLDLAALEHNIDAMAKWTSAHGVGVRPHAKAHKCVEIARRQLAAGAVGLTAATVYEAEAVLAASPPEVLISNEVVGDDHLRRLTAVASGTALVVAVDDPENARQVSAAAAAAGVEIGVLVDVDVGMGRCGVRSAPEAVALAEHVHGLPHLRLRGVMGYEGHVVLEPDPQLRAQRALAAMDVLAAAVHAIEDAGHPVEIVSAGGTNTHDMTGLHDSVTELQAGTYAVMDTGYAALAPRFLPVLSVQARVLSHQAGAAVLDCGMKAVSIDVTPPSLPASVGTVREVHEEHLILDPAPGADLRLGQPVRIAVGYSGGTVNLHDAYYVVDGGELVDVWPILARGPGRTPTMAAGVVT
jgi:D-serine deaminase-like pyridoxal phosphate-dependent protein